MGLRFFSLLSDELLWRGGRKMTSKHWLKFCLVSLILIAAVSNGPAVSAHPLIKPLADGYLANCTGEYFNNVALTGSPSYTRTDAAINFFWGESASPAPGIGVNNYSVRWTCSVNAPSSQNYSFNVVADDGMNVLVDGNLILWAWYDEGPTSDRKSVV
jgi:hypothetical protein